MGKTKIKTIDDSVPVEEPKKKPAKQADSLVESLKKELGIENQLSDKPKTGKQTAENRPASPRGEKQKTDNRTKPRSKKYQGKAQLVDSAQAFKLNEAVELVQKTSYTKFPGTVEIHINTNAKNLKGLVSLPFLAGKKLKILAFGPAIPSKTEGVSVGDEEAIQQILKGKINFDVLITTPEWMSKLAPAAKVLGPRGLMPNPKNGTITSNLKKTVEELSSGRTEYKTEPNGQVIHLSLGKVNQPAEEMVSNARTIYNALGRSKIKKITLSSTMGPGVKVDLSSI